jgi:hypothetical protein
MQKSKIPGTMPDPDRLYAMLQTVPVQFTTGQAFEAARAEGYGDTSERTLRKDLTRAAEAGILEKLSHGKWEKLEAGTTELRTRIGLSILSSTVRYEESGPTSEGEIQGPSPDELREAIDEYTPVFDEL